MAKEDVNTVMDLDKEIEDLEKDLLSEDSEKVEILFEEGVEETPSETQEDDIIELVADSEDESDLIINEEPNVIQPEDEKDYNDESSDDESFITIIEEQEEQEEGVEEVKQEDVNLVEEKEDEKEVASIFSDSSKSDTKGIIEVPKINTAKKEVQLPLLEEVYTGHEVTNIITNILDDIAFKDLSDTDFLDLCRLMKQDVPTLVATVKKTGINREILLQGKINQRMKNANKKQDGVYTRKYESIIAELQNRLNTKEPALSEKEFEDYCIFLGTTKESVENRASTLWVYREEVLKGLLTIKLANED